MQDKVLLISVDGMRPDSLPLCGAEGAVEFFTGGTYALDATTVIPPVTLPSHMSLFHSTDPDRHGTMSNVFMPQNHPVEGLVERLSGAGKTCAFFYNWEQLRDLCTPGEHLSFSWFLSWAHDPNGHTGARCAKAAEAYICESAPDFVFLYLVDADETGHEHGWMSKPYLDSVKEMMECVMHITEAVQDRYIVIVTADHGGHGRNHGEDIPEDMTIPITFRGDRFPAGKHVEDLSIKDIAPTITDLFGITPARAWEGRDILKSL